MDATDIPTESICFALGMCVAKPSSREPGKVATLAAELRRRGVFDALIETLAPELRDAVLAMEGMDRGAAWGRTGQRHLKSV